MKVRIGVERHKGRYRFIYSCPSEERKIKKSLKKEKSQ